MQNLLNKLTQLLEQDDRLIEDGKLLKNKIVELSLSLDIKLIKLLVSDSSIKKHFFIEIDDVLIFDKIKFQRFVSNKKFLPDSYTAYKNKIGLTADNEYISESKDVILLWPYKDCILEGGQNKEDSKRSEIFWNETLAPDEIDRLLSPKALTNFKRYDQLGEHEVTDLSLNDSYLIKGNNLLALHTIKKVYEGKVDLIYIDPPFNTESDSFQYNDSFKRSSWLTFMRSRLEIAKDLLSNSGTIYVHVDHNEGHYLKVLMDEIFEKEFFRNEIVWHYSGWNKKLSNSFEKRHDTIFMYGKSESQYFKSYFEKWGSKEEYVKRRKQKLLTDDDGREYVLSDAGGGKRVKMYIDEVLNGGVVVDDVWHIDKLNNSAKEAVGFQTQKTEVLLERIIKTSCPEGGLVLDFHVGSGTTAAVAHKTGRRFIGIEQMDYIKDITVERLRNVIGKKTQSAENMFEILEFDQEGISKTVDWKGGGSFIYCELNKSNQVFIDQIQDAKSSNELQIIWGNMQESAFLSYKLDLRVINENMTSFEALSFEEQQHFLIEILDKNMLYVPISEIEDESYKVSESDKSLNQLFFNLK